MGNPNNLIDLVKTFQEKVNQHDVEEIISLFTEDAEFEIVGLSKFSGKQNVKIIFEYDVAVNTNLQFINCKSEGGRVHCQILERNDRLDAVGISELKYSSCIFTFRNGLIKSFAAEIPRDFIEYNSKILKKFIPWLKENFPNEYAIMFTSEGRFIYNYKNGKDVVPLLRKWNIEQKTKE
jgi:limonene-1,2-epoxide hydrolase